MLFWHLLQPLMLTFKCSRLQHQPENLNPKEKQYDGAMHTLAGLAISAIICLHVFVIEEELIWRQFLQLA